MLPTPATAVDPAAQGGGMIPFRQATTERVSQLPSETAVAIATSTNVFDRNIDGSGYMYGIVLRMFATAAGNSANVAFAEDGPFSALDNITLHDVNGDIVNLDGYSLYLANLINADYRGRDISQAPNANLYNVVSGNVATGGTFAFTLRVPVATNRRDLLGLLGNQDRSQSYQLRTTIAGSAALYSTAPTTLPSATIEKYYESYAVPLPAAPAGQIQAQIPPSYGTIRFTSRSVSEAAPLGGSTINHYLRRIGNTIRWVAIVLRSNGSRATANANHPTSIQLKVGDETIFQETAAYRQLHNFERYGNRMPDGVFVYDNIHDFTAGAGAEMGNDFWHTQIVQNMQYQIAYPSGFGSTSNTLTFITDDMILRAPAPVRG